MIFIDYVAYAFLLIPIVCGLAISLAIAVAFVLIPIMGVIEHIRDDPKSVFGYVLAFFILMSAVWLDLRNRGIL